MPRIHANTRALSQEERELAASPAARPVCSVLSCQEHDERGSLCLGPHGVVMIPRDSLPGPEGEPTGGRFPRRHPAGATDRSPGNDHVAVVANNRLAGSDGSLRLQERHA